MAATLDAFHPAVRDWFERSLGEPSPPQRDGWPSIRRREHTLIAAPTGSGKTLAAFLSAIDELVCAAQEGSLEPGLQVLYVSPLKALSNDIERNLQLPLSGIDQALAEGGEGSHGIRTMVRTGDTPASKRSKATKNPPHIFVTTPESLYILLTSDGGRRMLATTRTVIVDEIHALVGNKRGSHLALSLERLEQLVRSERGDDAGLLRIGLSATQKPIEEVARFLVGTRGVREDGSVDCHIIDSGHHRALDLAIELPSSPLETVMSGDVWEELYDRLAALVEQHTTTLIFVNTRKLAERVTRHLSERVGEDAVTAHHGSLARPHRLEAEQRLKAGELKALVATASLELGIDIGDVDLVCQLGSTRAISTLLQRVGRSGHFKGGVPRGRLFPLSRDELAEAVTLLDCVRRAELDALCIPHMPLDIAAQQIVATLGAGRGIETKRRSVEEKPSAQARGNDGDAWDEDELFAMLTRAWPYRSLSRADFDALVHMLAQGFSTARGRRSAHIHHDAVNRRMRGRRGARLAAITSGGAIPDVADYQVVLEPTGTRVGTLNEDFAIESNAGDIFQLGNVSYRILRVETGKVRVEDARGQPPSIPFWLGEAPSRSTELSAAVSRLRGGVAARLGESRTAAVEWIADEIGAGDAAAQQLVDYLDAVQTTLGAMPTQDTLVLERFFDETGGMHLVVHAPFGSRINRALGLALRKCFCRKFNFELQAAAMEDAVILSLGPTHSFPLEDVWSFLNSATVRDVLVQALLDAPMFAVRWRWNAGRALAVLRFRGGRKVPPQLQRMDAEDLLTVCFPDQVACLENVTGDREIPDHPLVRQTIHDCLHEAMDIDGLEDLLRKIEGRDLTLLARDLTEPSPLAAEILNARPYAFLDDAPLEERRTQAVMSRRWLDPKSASDLGALDPAAIERVRREAWPDPLDADELHDALVLQGCVPESEGCDAGWLGVFKELERDRRATRVYREDAPIIWCAAERLPQVLALFENDEPSLENELTVPAKFAAESWHRDDALTEILRGRLEALPIVTAEQLGAALGLEASDVAIGLAALEGEGFVLRGRFSASSGADGAPVEWCERRLLARIHRYTLNKLRAEIEPVSAADFMRFLMHWQHVHPSARMKGSEALEQLLEQLDGFEGQAASWEADLLPSRVEDYDPRWLDTLCLSGRAAWARRSPRPTGTAGGNGGGRRSGPVRSSPIALMRRTALDAWLQALDDDETAQQRDQLSSPATAVLALLDTRGACFYDELLRDAGLVRAQLEDALGELVSAGIVSSDGFSGLRALVAPSSRRRGSLGRRRRAAVFTMESAGRWSTLRAAGGSDERERIETLAWVLLRRWGVVFRRLLDREGSLPPWRDMLRVYRRLEARGEIRGGRFVAGFSGEQYALPDAVGLMRKLRRKGGDDRLIAVSAADPLNLVGIITPGKRVPAISSNRVLYRNGVPIAAREGGVVRLLNDDDDDALRYQLESALIKRTVPAAVRAYLGNAV
jgi:ATP-dependent Lhr-like helicase